MDRPGLGWTCYDFAGFLLERDDDEDQVKAARLLNEALEISRDLGMRSLMEKVLAKREILRA